MPQLTEQEEFELLSLKRKRGSGGAPPPAAAPKSRLQLQHEHNLNREAEAQTAFQPIKNTGNEVATLLRNIGLVASKTPLVGGAVAATGEAAAQGVEMAGGSRDKFSPGGVALQSALPAVGVGAGKIIGAAGRGLRASAEKSISQVFGPTKGTAKFITKEKLVPEVLRRGIVAGSREGLEARAAQSSDEWGQALEQAYAGLPQGASVKPEPIIQALEKVKDKFFTVEKGVRVQLGDDIEKQAVRQVEKMQKSIIKLASVPNTATLIMPGGQSVPILNDVSIQSMRKLRQRLDDTVAKAGGFAGADIKVQNKLWARRESTNAIRHEMAQEYPSIAKINAEFSFWQNMDDVLGATQLRTQGQAVPLTRQLFRISGAIGGAAGGGVEGSIVGLAAAEALSRAMQSTGWRTVSGQTKNAISKMLANRNVKAAAALATRVIAGNTISELSKE